MQETHLHTCCSNLMGDMDFASWWFSQWQFAIFLQQPTCVGEKKAKTIAYKYFGTWQSCVPLDASRSRLVLGINNKSKSILLPQILVHTQVNAFTQTQQMSPNQWTRNSCTFALRKSQLKRERSSRVKTQSRFHESVKSVMIWVEVKKKEKERLMKVQILKSTPKKLQIEIN